MKTELYIRVADLKDFENGETVVADKKSTELRRKKIIADTNEIEIKARLLTEVVDVKKIK